MPEAHTSFNLAQRVGQLMLDMMPKDALLITTTVDGAPDMNKMARILHVDIDAAAHRELNQDNFDEDDVDRATAVLSCSAHAMALALKSAAEIAESDINIVRGTMVAISDSPTLLNMLHDEQRTLGIAQSNPVLDVATRFGSTVDMLDDYNDKVYRPMCAAAVAGACAIERVFVSSLYLYIYKYYMYVFISTHLFIP